MASANGFGLTSAASNLAFVYDVGDTYNCYLGEPTTNQFAVLGTPGLGAASDNAVNFAIQGTTGFIRMGYDQTFGGYTIQPGDVVYKYNLGSYGCHYHGNTAAIPSGVQATFSFEYYLSPDVVIETSFLANFENYGGNGLSGGIGVPNSTTGVWHKASFTSGPTAGTGTQAMFLYPGGCGGRLSAQGYILYKNPQVEWKAYPTQFVQGTRSSTQALFNLRNQTGLDASTVSYTTTPFTPLPFFDGTDDYLNLPPANVPTGNEITVELICAWNGGLQANSIIAGGAGGNQDLSLHLPWSDGNVYWDAGRPFNRIFKFANPSEYLGNHHWVCTKNANTGNMSIFLDGNLWHSGEGLTSSLPSLDSASIGRYDNGSFRGYYYKGNIFVVKIYNKALTLSQVQNNYQNYKSRFNLP